MKQLSWDEYYEKFYDWAESTQVRNLSALTSLGTADEVGEIIMELQDNVPASNRLLRKAVEAKLEFSVSDLMEFLDNNDKDLAIAAIRNSVNRLTAEDMEDLYDVAEDDEIIEICIERNLPLPEALREEYFEEVEEDLVYEKPKPKKIGFFGALAAILGASQGIDNLSRPQRHHGRCNGDCANCPPHYGYRYGRWYYGHDHVYGCEFGGNKGSGRRD